MFPFGFWVTPLPNLGLEGHFLNFHSPFWLVGLFYNFGKPSHDNVVACCEIIGLCCNYWHGMKWRDILRNLLKITCYNWWSGTMEVHDMFWSLRELIFPRAWHYENARYVPKFVAQYISPHALIADAPLYKWATCSGVCAELFPPRALIADVASWKCVTYSRLYVAHMLFVTIICFFLTTTSSRLAIIFIRFVTAFSGLATTSIGFATSCSSFATYWFKLVTVCSRHGTSVLCSQKPVLGSRQSESAFWSFPKGFSSSGLLPPPYSRGNRHDLPSLLCRARYEGRIASRSFHWCR